VGRLLLNSGFSISPLSSGCFSPDFVSDTRPLSAFFYLIRFFAFFAC
jgi:hypothetical protein